jgi:Ca2+-binding EF-hand superfamily protein
MERIGADTEMISTAEKVAPMEPSGDFEMMKVAGEVSIREGSLSLSKPISGQISMKAFPKRMRERLAKFDVDDDGMIGENELQLLEAELEAEDESVSRNTFSATIFEYI